MGNQVVVSFLTDHWHETKKDPEMFVRVIDRLLAYGSESLVEETLARRRGRRGIVNRMEEGRWADSHYVTVHRYQHADVPQVTFTQYNSSYDVYDLTRAIELGLLERKTNRGTWRNISRGIIQDLRDKADALEQAINDDVRAQAVAATARMRGED